MAFPDRLRLPLSFDPARLARDLATVSSADWIAHFVPQNYDGDWSAIPLRGAAGATHPIKMIYADPTATEFEDTPFLAPCPYFREVLAAFQCELQCVRLMRLTPGSTIKEHHDLDLDAKHGSARLHIPVITNPEVEFELSRRRIVMAPGEVWYLRLADPHRVYNRGTTDRVHLVIDTLMNDWLAGMMVQAAEAAANAP
jgi:hypothetical protein